jgi:RimJ/RimL family protein N-acetyltransferase
MPEAQIPAGEPVLNIRGDKIALGPLRRDLLPIYMRWMNDFEVTKTQEGVPRPWTLEAEETWYDKTIKDESNVVFTIYELPDLRPIGTCGLHHVDFFHRCGEFGITIGEKSCWGKGYGTEATRLVLDYAFNVLQIHSIMLIAAAHNERGLRAYEKAGFKLVGRWRESDFLGGKAYDCILMDTLATEFEGPSRALPGLMGNDEKGSR